MAGLRQELQLHTVEQKSLNKLSSPTPSRAFSPARKYISQQPAATRAIFLRVPMARPEISSPLIISDGHGASLRAKEGKSYQRLLLLEIHFSARATAIPDLVIPSALSRIVFCSGCLHVVVGGPVRRLPPPPHTLPPSSRPPYILSFITLISLYYLP